MSWYQYPRLLLSAPSWEIGSFLGIVLESKGIREKGVRGQGTIITPRLMWPVVVLVPWVPEPQNLNERIFCLLFFGSGNQGIVLVELRNF